MISEPRIDISQTKFESPVKCIFDSQGASDFQQSVAIDRLKYHLEKYARMIHGQPIVHEPSGIEVVNRVVSLLEAF